VKLDNTFQEPTRTINTGNVKYFNRLSMVAEITGILVVLPRAMHTPLISIGRVFTSDFSGRLASENRKSRENSYFSHSLKVKRVGKLQCNSH